MANSDIALWSLGDKVTVASGKIRYEIVKIEPGHAGDLHDSAHFYLSALRGQGTDGYLPPHRREVCMVGAHNLKRVKGA